MPLVLVWIFETPSYPGKNEGLVRVHPGCFLGPGFQSVFSHVSFLSLFFFFFSFFFFASHSLYTQVLLGVRFKELDWLYFTYG